MTFKEACSACADLFEAIPRTWTRHVGARDENGSQVDANSPKACQWCAMGAIKACGVYGDMDPIANKLGYYPSRKLCAAAIANDKGGRLVAIKMLRMAAGEL